MIRPAASLAYLDNSSSAYGRYGTDRTLANSACLLSTEDLRGQCIWHVDRADCYQSRGSKASTIDS